MAGLTLVTPPAIEPFTLAAAKSHLRITSADTTDDDYIEDELIQAARERCETVTNRQLITATWDYKLDGFPASGVIVMPKPPLLTVTSVSYVDSNGASQTFSSTLYTVRVYAGPKAQRGTVALNYGQVWPVTRDQLDAVTIRFTCGYGATAASVPRRLVMAMKLDMGTLYANREDIVVGTIVTEMPGSASAHAEYLKFKSWPTEC